MSEILGARGAPPGVDLTKLRGICDDVYKNFHVDDHPRFLYAYERKIVEAAGVPESEIEGAMNDPSRPVRHASGTCGATPSLWTPGRTARGDRSFAMQPTSTCRPATSWLAPMTAPKLQPLRVSAGWLINWNTLDELDPEEEGTRACGGSSTFMATNEGRRFLIDVEWRPEFDPEGSFRMRVEYAPWERTERGRRRIDAPLHFRDAEVVHEFETRSHAELVRERHRRSTAGSVAASFPRRPLSLAKSSFALARTRPSPGLGSRTSTTLRSPASPSAIMHGAPSRAT